MRLPLTLLACAAVGCAGPAAVPVAPAEPLVESVEAVVARYPEATVAVAVRQGGGDAETRYARLGDRPFHAASTMKVPVMIEAFRQVADGRRAWDDPVLVENRFRSIVDGSAYAIEDDTDDALYEVRGQTLSLRNLVDRAITTSSNLATNLLIGLVTADSVQATVDRLGAPGMRVLRGVEDLKAFEAGLNNETTADALATLLAALRDGRAVSPEADAEMLDVLDDQAFNEMIPAGLPRGTRVAHKTGWITEIHHDAAVVYPRGSAPYVLVILTEGIADRERSARLGAEIAAAVHAALVR
ncbi:serine hydrolase [Rubrivirga sp. IMCC45206]|uniref:serine hydrolase n=1 Tax=Rubrivirga sp. IMCC45206 TaxID=3391614 RepID=UPI0039901ACB